MQSNAGLELGLFEDRLFFVADYFKKETNDILVRVPLPQTAGNVAPPYINAGAVENKGFELAATWKGSLNAFRYSVSGNISFIQNKVTSLGNSEPILGGFGLSDGPITRTDVGYPIGSFYMYKMLGIFKTQDQINAAPFQNKNTRPGDVQFADLNGDGVIDDKDRTQVGSPFPKYTYAMSFNCTYKNFDFSVFGQGVQGNDVYFLYGNFAYEAPARGFNSYAAILGRWTPSNPNATIPKVSIDDQNGNSRTSTRFLEDGSYLKIRNVTLGYTFKDIFAKGIKSIRVYATAQNLFTFTKYSGLDPEIQANTNDTRGYGVSSDLAVGIDWGTVPSPRTFLFGVEAKF